MNYSFKDYIQRQFDTPLELQFQPIPTNQLLNTHHHNPFTNIEVENAMRTLKNKAIGLDCLKASLLKLPAVLHAIVPKITQAFNRWQQEGYCPLYLKSAKIIPLSKQDTEHPDYGQIRLIAILPTISKVYEKCLLKRLDDEIAEQGGLHPS